MLTPNVCRDKAAALSRLAADAITDAEASRLDVLAREWAVLEATVAAMDDREARCIHRPHVASVR
jgi:hypothetical protein